MEKDNGIYFLYDHTDWKTEDCDYIAYDFSDLLQKQDSKEDKQLTKEQKENKSKLSIL